ncbi:MAG: DNA-binding transcriptional regulator [bacterium]
MSKYPLKIALLVENSRTYGRGIVRGISRYASEHGPWSFAMQLQKLPGELPEWLKTWKGDGIIAWIEDRWMAEELLKLKCPLVDVLGAMKGRGMPSFDTDAQAVAKMAGDFFLQAGFKHFAYCGFKGVWFSDERGAALSAYLAKKGIKVLQSPGVHKPPQAVNFQVFEQPGMNAEPLIGRWLESLPRPLAVLACNDVRAHQVLNVCRDRNIRVPEDVAVMGVDNDELLCTLCDPPLTCIEPDTERLGYEAAALLHRAMKGRGTLPARLTRIPPLRLVERTSTDVIAMDDPVMVQALRYIRNEISHGIMAKDVLKHVHRSRPVVEQRFQRWLGRSIRSEIQHRRLEQVCRLLLETKLDLAGVVRQVGLSTAAHLCRIFQEHYHQTPSQFRAAQSTYKNT